MADDLRKNAEELASNMRDALFFSRDFANEAKGISKELYGVSLTASETAKAFKESANAAKNITDEVDKVIEGQTTLNSVQKRRAELSKAESALNREYDQFLINVIGNEAEIARIKNGQLDVEDAILNAAIERGTITESEVGAAADLARLFGEQRQEIESSAVALDDVEARTQNIEKSMSILGGSIGLADVGGALDKGLRKLGAGGIADKLNISGAVEGAKKYAAELSNGGEKALGLGGRLKVVGKMAGNMGKALNSALGPIGLITMAIQGIVDLMKFFFGQAMAIDKEIGDTADNLGVSYSQAQKLTEEASKQVDETAKETVLRSELVEASNKLNKEFGQTVIFSGKIGEELVKSTKFLNLSEEAAMGFAKASMQTGQSIEQLQTDIVGVTQELNSQNNLAMSQKEIMEGVAKASDAQFLTAGGSAKELAKQVFEAKKLGLELSDMEKIGGNLLDLESSLRNEMQAELLTGRSLNLEKARQAALDGNLGVLAEEISKNIGDSADFAKMNVIQQEALAKAVGMTREELAGSLREQEQLKAIQEMMGDDIENMNDAQKEFNRLKEAGLLNDKMREKLAKQGLLDQMDSQSIEDKRKDTQDLAMQSIQKDLIPAMTDMRDMMMQVSGQFQNIVNSIKEFFKPIMDTIRETIDRISERMNELFGTTEGVGGTFEAIGEFLQDMIEMSIENIGSIINGILLSVSGLFDIFKGIGMLFTDDWQKGLELIGSGIFKFIMGPIEGFINLLINGINLIIEGINLIPGIELPRIPLVDMTSELAEGGVVMPRPGGSVHRIGEAGDAEMVLPLSKAEEMGFGGKDNNSQAMDAEAKMELQMMNRNLKELISAVKEGGDVLIDGNKVGKALVLASSKLGS